MRGDYQKKHEKHLLLKEKYDSHEQELRDKKKKLIKLYEKYKQLSYNIENLQCSFENKRQKYLNIIRILNKKIQIKNTIIQYFIKPNQLQKLYQTNNRIIFDQKDQLYKINKLDLNLLKNTIKKPISCKPQTRIKPVCEYNRIQCVILQNNNPRYRYDNILQLSLDMPQRTTQDYF